MATNDDLCPKCHTPLVQKGSLFRCGSCGFEFRDTSKDAKSTELKSTDEDLVAKSRLKLEDAIMVFDVMFNNQTSIGLLLSSLKRLGDINIAEMNVAYKNATSRPHDEDVSLYKDGTWRYRSYQLFKAGWMARCIYEGKTK